MKQTPGLRIVRGAYTYTQHIPAPLRAVLGVGSTRFVYISAASKMTLRDAIQAAQHLRQQTDALIERAKQLTPAQRQEAIQAGGLLRLDALDALSLNFIAAGAIDGPTFDETMDTTTPAGARLAADQMFSVTSARATLSKVRRRIATTKLTLADVHRIWHERAQPRGHETGQAAQRWLDRLAAFVGHDDATQITVADARAFAASLEQSSVNRTTARAAIGKLRTMFGHAVAIGALDVNVFADARVHITQAERDRHETTQRAMTTAQAKLMLDRLNELNDATLRQCVRVMAYSGMRCSEFANLTRDDLTSIDGVNVFSIRNSKTASSTRAIPVHYSIADIWTTLRASNVQQLFAGSDRIVRVRRFQRAINPWLRRLDLPPLHSLRHTFKAACVRANVPIEISAAIMGHRLAGVHHAYGGRPSVALLADWINRIDPTA